MPTDRKTKLCDDCRAGGWTITHVGCDRQRNVTTTGECGECVNGRQRCQECNGTAKRKCDLHYEHPCACVNGTTMCQKCHGGGTRVVHSAPLPRPCDEGYTCDKCGAKATLCSSCGGKGVVPVEVRHAD